MHTIEDLMQAIERLEATIYGDPSRDKKGVVERLNNQESFMAEIRDLYRKIIWLLVAGVAGAGLNLILNTRNMSQQQQQQNQAPAASHPK
jgi:hypothetical protein